VLLGPVGYEKLYAHASGQPFLDLRRPVVTVSDGHSTGSLKEFGEHGKLVGVGWSYRQAGNETWPAHPHMHPEAVEGVLEECVLVESGLSPKAAAPVSAGEKTHWQRHGVHQREASIVRSEAEELLPEILFDLPEVGCLPTEGGPMDLAEGREPFAVVPSEEEVDSLVGVDAEELSDHFDSEDPGVGELWSGTALADTPTFELVVYEAEDADDKGAKIHKNKTSVTFGAIGLTPSVGRSSLWLNSSREKLAHGVN
jgi:hypothetical protein